MTRETLITAALAFPAVLVIWYVGRWRERARARARAGLVVILGRELEHQPDEGSFVVLMRPGPKCELRPILYEERQ